MSQEQTTEQPKEEENEEEIYLEEEEEKGEEEEEKEEEKKEEEKKDEEKKEEDKEKNPKPAKKPLIIDVWANCMSASSWNFEIIPNKNIIALKVSVSDASHMVSIKINEKTCLVLGQLVYERRCPQRYRKNMIEFLTRLNFNLAVGGFIVNPHDGEVRFRHSVDVESIDLQPVFVSNFIRHISLLGCRHYENISKIMDGFEPSKVWKDRH